MSGKDFQNINVVEFIFESNISFYPMYINDEPVLLVLLFIILKVM